jgi:hypothetical protein
MEPKPGEVYVNKYRREYTMKVVAVRNGYVIWDGIYAGGYDTPLREWNKWMAGGEWELQPTQENT